jgi:hypothetical protein
MKMSWCLHSIFKSIDRLENSISEVGIHIPAYFLNCFFFFQTYYMPEARRDEGILGKLNELVMRTGLHNLL